MDAAGDTGQGARREVLGAGVRTDILARRLPKADLHLHLQGAARPSLVHARRGQAVTGPPGRPDGFYDYTGIPKFFDDLERAMALLVTREDVTRLAVHVLEGAVDSGCRHVELMVTPDIHRRAGTPVDDLFDGLADAFADMTARGGFSGGIIVEMDRALGPDAGVRLVREATAARDRGVPILGIGNDGEWQTVAFSALAPAYELARREGFNLCGHADTFADVRDAIDLGLDRIDHAFELAGDDELVAQVRSAGTPITCCLTSNSVMWPEQFPDIADHPFGQLRRAGLHVTVNTDDPPMFFTDLTQEYRAGARAFGWTPEVMGEIALAGLRAAWLGDGRETRLAAWEREVAALLDDVRAPFGATP
jgi:adenosine deaminase